MKFEEALSQLREGKKITHSHLGDQVYFMACRVSLPGDGTELPLSIVKMQGDRIHPDMSFESIDGMLYPGTLIMKEKVFENPCKHGHFPQLNLLLVISDEWEVFE